MKTNYLSFLKVFLIYLLFLSFLPASFSQTTSDDSFAPGYIIDKNGQEIKGLIKVRGHNSNRQVCYFKESSKAKVISYTPDLIKGYGINDRMRFKSAQINDKGEVIWGFIEYMLKGELDLLFYQRRFFIDGKSGFQESIVVEDTVRNNEKIMVRTKGLYKNQLLKEMETCPNLAEKIINSEYLQNSLKDLFLAYYECINQDYKKFTEGDQGVKIRFGASISLYAQTMSIEKYNSPIYYFEDARTQFNFSLKPQILFEFSYPSRNQDITFRTGLTFFKYNFLFSETSERTGTELLYELPIKMTAIGIPTYVTYALKSQKTAPYLLLGMETAFILNYEAYRQVTTISGVRVSNRNFSGRDFYLNLRAGAGLKSSFNQKIEGFLELYFEKSTDFGGPTTSQPAIYMGNLVFAGGLWF